MADTDDNNSSNSDSTFEAPPPKPPKLYQVGILVVYHILLAVFLAHAIYKVWPPQPKPDDNKAKTATSSANANSSAANANTAGANVRPGAAAGVGTNINAASGNTSTSAPAGNANASARASNSAINTNAASVGGTVASNGNTNAPGAANVNNEARTTTDSDTESNEELPPPFQILWWEFQPSLEVRLLLLVMLVGAIGSYVYATSSIVDYLGNRTFISSWFWWYLLRPFIGMMLALVFYFVFRGGFITGGVNASGDDAARFINPFGIAALAGLVGMFSKVASDKLNEVFTTLFRPAPGQGDAKRGDKLSSSPVPSVTSINPATVKVGATDVSIIIKGTNFVEKSDVKFNGESRTSKFVDATELSVQLLDKDTATAGTIDITVVNPSPGGGSSKPLKLTVET